MRTHGETWLYRCVKEHGTYLPSHSGRRPKVTTCDICGRDAFWVNQEVPMIGGVGLNSYTKNQFRHAFDQKTTAGLGSVRDIDRAFDTFHAKYPHLKRPEAMKRDPLPTTHLRDERGNHGEND